MEVANSTAQMQIEYNAQGHTLDGRPFQARFDDAGYKYSTIGENVFAYSKNVLESHGAFNIDWGNGPGGVQSPPGHRENKMGIGGASAFKEIGIRVEDDVPLGKKVGPQIVTHDFGARMGNNDHFITGVVYDDKNNNNFYDVGEGIAGVTVSPNNGRYHAVTGPSGAYTIPFSSSDNITEIEAFSDTFELQVVKVDLKAENYKLDFNVQKTGANGDASVGFSKLDLTKKSMIIDISKEVKAPCGVVKNFIYGKL